MYLVEKVYVWETLINVCISISSIVSNYILLENVLIFLQKSIYVIESCIGLKFGLRSGDQSSSIQ